MNSQRKRQLRCAALHKVAMLTLTRRGAFVDNAESECLDSFRAFSGKIRVGRNSF